MSTSAVYTDSLIGERTESSAVAHSDPALGAAITKIASQQSYYIIHFLVDRERRDHAYRAYAYFRWVDDSLDQRGSWRSDNLAFIERQRQLVERCYHGEPLCDLVPEENMLRDLIRSDSDPGSGVAAYIQQMMAVMEFDARRRGRLITQRQLDEYSHHLAVAVMEALHYFIGHACHSPHGEQRYLAAIAAHITHLLRDTVEDVDNGYFNIPSEYLSANNLHPADIASPAYRSWVRSRVQLARDYFAAGKRYLAQISNLRCKLAGYAYIARFEQVLNAIERDHYLLRADYADCKDTSAALRMGWSVLWQTLI
ncbi:MAG: squalene/phytoene synthase family protein [Anaerolineae bacterium]|nr:squalene/phytoene synthase family protein [Anaerolineae bacterium]